MDTWLHYIHLHAMQWLGVLGWRQPGASGRSAGHSAGIAADPPQTLPALRSLCNSWCRLGLPFSIRQRSNAVSGKEAMLVPPADFEA